MIARADRFGRGCVAWVLAVAAMGLTGISELLLYAAAWVAQVDIDGLEGE